MIPVHPVTEPAEWSTRGTTPGEAWLLAHPLTSRPKDRTFRPRDFWSPFREQLAAGFQDRCGYTAIFVPNGTVDHFVPWEDVRGTPDEALAYDWSNFRYADGWFNSARKRTPVPDPYKVGADWFRLSLPDLQLEATSAVPTDQISCVKNVLQWLRNDERVMKTRRKWYGMYRDGTLSLAGLRQLAPLIAAALERQPEFLLPADQPAAPPAESPS